MQGSCCYSQPTGCFSPPKSCAQQFLLALHLAGIHFEPFPFDMEQVAESSPFPRVASNPGEPCAKKAKTASALDLPHGICEELTASLKIALWEGERATKPSNAELCAKTASPRPSRCRWGTTPAPAQMWILLNIKTCLLRRGAGVIFTMRRRSVANGPLVARLLLFFRGYWEKMWRLFWEDFVTDGIGHRYQYSNLFEGSAPILQCMCCCGSFGPAGWPPCNLLPLRKVSGILTHAVVWTACRTWCLKGFSHAIARRSVVQRWTTWREILKIIDLALAVEVWQCPLDLALAVEIRQRPLLWLWYSRLVRQCPLSSGTRSWGPAVPTEIWSSRLRTRRRWGEEEKRRRGLETLTSQRTTLKTMNTQYRQILLEDRFLAASFVTLWGRSMTPELQRFQYSCWRWNSMARRWVLKIFEVSKS